VTGLPKVGKSLLVANLALALAAGQDRAGFHVPAARRVLICQFELPVPQFISPIAVEIPHRHGIKPPAPKLRTGARRTQGPNNISDCQIWLAYSASYFLCAVVFGG